MKTDLFQSCGRCWVFQIFWHIGCSTFTATSFRIWNSSTAMPSPPLALLVVMLPKVHLTSYSRMSGSRLVSKRQIWLWSMEWSRTKANRIQPREHNGHSKHTVQTTPENTLHMDITRWPTKKSDWLYYFQPKMEKLYIASKNKIGSWLWLRSWAHYCQIKT